MGTGGFGGMGGNGKWSAQESKRSYEAYNLAHGRTPGDIGNRGSGRSGGRSLGRFLWTSFLIPFVMGFYEFLSAGMPFLLVLVLSLGISTAFTLLVYGIIRLCSR